MRRATRQRPLARRPHATLYRGQAKTLASTLGRSDADLTALFKQAEADIVAQRQNRAPDDFAVWVAGEADDCPPI